MLNLIDASAKEYLGLSVIEPHEPYRFDMEEEKRRILLDALDVGSKKLSYTAYDVSQIYDLYGNIFRANEDIMSMILENAMVFRRDWRPSLEEDTF